MLRLRDHSSQERRASGKEGTKFFKKAVRTCKVIRGTTLITRRLTVLMICRQQKSRPVAVTNGEIGSQVSGNRQCTVAQDTPPASKVIVPSASTIWEKLRWGQPQPNRVP